VESIGIAPRKGHLEGTQCIYGYLVNFRNVNIWIRVDEPDYSDLPDQTHEWLLHFVYGDVKESVPLNIQEALGNFAMTTT